MKPVSILIVEDKVIIAENLGEILSDAGYEIAGKITSGEEALVAIEQLKPDLILMDIQLAGKLDGIQTAERLNHSYSIPIIYLTDFHDAKTIERAKYTEPSAFLLKPFKANDLLIAIEIGFYNASTKKKASPGKNEKTGETFFPFTDRVFIKDKDALIRINVDEILWIEADGSYCHIHTTNKTIILTISMKVFHEKFNHHLLMRVHRSNIVNVDKVTAIRGTRLVIDSKEIPTSDKYREEIERRFPTI